MPHISYAKKIKKKLATYLKYKPFGEGLGLSGDGLGVKISTRFTTSIPTDSWYVKIWVETGIVGLILYLSMIFFYYRMGRVDHCHTDQGS